MALLELLVLSFTWSLPECCAQPSAGYSVTRCCISGLPCDFLRDQELKGSLSHFICADDFFSTLLNDLLCTRMVPREHALAMTREMKKLPQFGRTECPLEKHPQRSASVGCTQWTLLRGTWGIIPISIVLDLTSQQLWQVWVTWCLTAHDFSTNPKSWPHCVSYGGNCVQSNSRPFDAYCRHSTKDNFCCTAPEIVLHHTYLIWKMAQQVIVHKVL